MSIDLYYTPASGPSRLVLLTGAALGIKFNLKHVDIFKGEQITSEYTKLNPQHAVPTIVDNGFVLWESRTISRYLVNKYGGNSNLYPLHLQTRAIIDQRMDFELGTLKPRFLEYIMPQLLKGEAPNEELFKKLDEALGIFNIFLENFKYAAGSNLSLADLSSVTTVSTIDAAGISLKPYPNVERWFELVKATAPGYKEANEEGVEVWRALMKNVRAKS